MSDTHSFVWTRDDEIRQSVRQLIYGTSSADIARILSDDEIRLLDIMLVKAKIHKEFADQPAILEQELDFINHMINWSSPND